MKKYILYVLFFISGSSFSQYNEWTWMNGTNTPWGPQVPGTQGVPSPNNTPASSYESIEWTDNTGNFWLLDNSGYFWKYDPVINMWMFVSNSPAPVWGVQGIPSTSNFPGMHGFGGVTWTDNNNNLWLYGGIDAGRWDDNLWKYNITTNEWTWMKGTGAASGCATRVYGTQGVGAPANTPGSRAETAASWKDANGDLWLFGGQGCSGSSGTGYSSSGNLSDVWMYEIATNNWIWKNGATTPIQAASYGAQGTASGTTTPGARYPYACGEYHNGSILLFGATSVDPNNIFTNTHRNDLWKYDHISNQWTWLSGPNTINQVGVFGVKCVPAIANIPGSGFEARTRWTDSCGNLWVFGTGSGPASALASNDLWMYSKANNTWMWVSGTTQQNNPGTFGTKGVGSPANIPPSGIQGGNPFKNKTAFYFFGGMGWNTLWKYEPDKPTALFSLTSLSGCVPAIASFTNTSTPGCNEIKDWIWSFGDPASGVNNTSTLLNPIHTYSAAGTYSVQLIVTNCTGSKDTAVQNIIITPSLVIYTQSVTICTGSSYTLPGGSVVSVAGVYTYSTTTSNGCDSVVTTNLAVVNSFSLTQNSTICAGQNFTLPGGSIVSSSGVYTDTITAGGGCDSIITTNLNVVAAFASTQTVSICSGTSFTLPGGAIVNISGIYNDTLVAAGGCDSIITTYLTVKPISTSVQNATICSGQNFILPGGTSVSSSGTYADTLTAVNGCDSIVATNLMVNPSPNISVSADVTITIGSITTLSASGGGTYMWSPSEALSSTTDSSVIASPVQSTVYCVTVTNSNGCSDTACIYVFVELVCGELYLPNAFSPNSDNENDDFKAYIEPVCVSEFKLIIYNRWGEKVFETEDVTQSWDGRFKGIISNPAVYAYYCKAELTNGKTIEQKGNVSLVR